MKRFGALLLTLSACQAIGPSGDEAHAPKAKPAAEAPADPAPPIPLPDKFVVVGAPKVESAFLDPRAAWRHLRSRLTTLQADARRWDQDLLVSFEPRAVHWTDRDGARTTWELPEGLVLGVATPHVVVRNDLTLVGFRADGTQIPAEEELTVATVTWSVGPETKSESRLIIKGGKAFRSMTPR
jgi:hypothetical protein